MPRVAFGTERPKLHRLFVITCYSKLQVNLEHRRAENLRTSGDESKRRVNTRSGINFFKTRQISYPNNFNVPRVAFGTERPNLHRLCLITCYPTFQIELEHRRSENPRVPGAVGLNLNGVETRCIRSIFLMHDNTLRLKHLKKRCVVGITELEVIRHTLRFKTPESRCNKGGSGFRHVRHRF